MSLVKKAAKVAAGLLGAAYLVSAPFSVYLLHKTEYGVEKRFGAVVQVTNKPGPHLKNHAYIPLASIFTTVEKYDKRILEYTDSAESIITKDRKYIDSNRFCKWRIQDPEKYVNFVRAEEKAQSLLDDIVFNKVWTEVASHTFEENQSTKRKEIRERMIEEGNKQMNMYGIEILDIRIKKLNIPEKNRPKIHERMIEEAKKQAATIMAKGESEKRNILGQKDNIVRRLEAEGRKEAETILGKAEKEVADVYAAAYGEDLEFYKFWERMETFKEMAKANPKIILSTDNPLLESLLTGEKETKKKD